MNQTGEQTIVFGEGHLLIVRSDLKFCALFWRFKQSIHKAETLALTCMMQPL